MNQIGRDVRREVVQVQQELSKWTSLILLHLRPQVLFKQQVMNTSGSSNLAVDAKQTTTLSDPQPATDSADAQPTHSTGAARGRSGSEEGKVAPGMADLTQLIKGLVQKVNLLERSVHDRQQEPQAPAVTPDRLGHSVYRQALEQGGSLGLQRMRLDELGGGQFGHGVSTPGGFAGVYTPAPKVPSAKDAKIPLRNFEGNEVYKGLGSGFEQWVLLFIEQVEMAEIACGYKWPETFKVNKFGQHLRGKAELFFQQHIMRWWNTQPTLWYVMEQMHMSFRCHISTQQGMRLFGQRKEPSRSWNDHFLYLNALMAATNTSPALVLENIVKYAEPDLRHAMMAKVGMNRPDSLQQANELIVWAQMMADEDKFPKSFGKGLVGAMAVGTASESKKGMRKCFKCNEVGHLKLNCPQLNTESDGAKTVEPIAFSLAAGELSLTVAPGGWILGSGASRHLTNDFALLRDVVACKAESSCVMPDGKRMDVLKKGKVTLRAVVDGVARDVVLTDVYYAPKLVQNLISYGRLMPCGCALKERGDQWTLVKGTDTICYVDLLSNVLVARAVERLPLLTGWTSS
ncbi:unnamed protein product [Phytophthora fragariaefolia]|uniref:Unnamed protein product n=1 Tax=Phytophthora fragariaefolia TaxID=1490495 RepID=A0A9W6Y0Y2_9STRA|nr:unnamed protein product [Phytophthora fragariaefolia]